MDRAQTWFLEKLSEREYFSALSFTQKLLRVDRNISSAALASNFVMDYIVPKEETLEDLLIPSDSWKEEKYDVIVGSDLFECCEKPWILAEDILNSLNPNGLFFFKTRLTYHNTEEKPNDFFRYTTEGLKTLFSAASKVEVGKQHPCFISYEGWSEFKQDYLYSCIAGIK